MHANEAGGLAVAINGIPLQNAVTATDQQIDALVWGPLRLLTSAPTVAETANELECTPIDSMRCSGVS